MFGKKSDHYYQGAVPQSATNPRTEFKIFQISVGYDFLVDLGVRTFRLQHTACVCMSVWGFWGCCGVGERGVCLCVLNVLRPRVVFLFLKMKKKMKIFL